MQQIPDDIKEMKERIAAVKEKSAQQKAGKAKHTDFSQTSIALQVAIELVSGTFVGASIGYILDEVFDTKFIFLLIFIIFGSLAGLVNVARYLKKADADEKKEK